MNRCAGSRRQGTICRCCLTAMVVVAGGLARAQAQDSQEASPAGRGRDIYVHPELGDDRRSGLAPQVQTSDGPVKTIKQGLRLARPGDTVHLFPATEPYHETAVFHNLHGEPSRPITLDAHGATITGTESLAAAECQQVAPGLYRNERLIPAKLVTAEDAVSRRWFFLFDGRVNRMGRTLKGKNAPYKKPTDLAVGEWTYQREENAHYVKIDPAKQLDDYRIEWPARGAGVQVSGDCSFLVIRNLIATHVYNDGYNIHGKTRDVRFENIQAIECGDDGFSAHDDCQTFVDGFISIGNSTGIANAGESVTSSNRVLIDGTAGTDLLYFGSGRHQLINSVVYSKADFSAKIWSDQGADMPCRLLLQNVLIVRTGTTDPLNLLHNAVVDLDHVTLIGLGMQAKKSSLALRHSIVAGWLGAAMPVAATPMPEIALGDDVRWTADDNRYDLERLAIGKQAYAAATFPAYQRASGQDAASLWHKVEFIDPFTGKLVQPLDGIGVDFTRLPSRPAK